jgi:CheY-like chemotaxis protein
MNGIIGMTELVLDSKLTDEQRDYLKTVRDSADALLALLDDILDFSKIEARKLEIEHVEFHLRELLGDILKLLSFRSSPSVLQLSCDVRADTPDTLIGDPNRLRQVLINLVGNAIKFTSKGQVIIRVRPESVRRDEAVLFFSVTDTGIGIPQEKQKIIFEAFAQADASTTRRFGGSGLGLTISNQLVHLMGGRISVDSKPDVGSTFYFTIPFSIGGAGTNAAHEGSEIAPKELEPLDILVVEDNAVNQKLATVLLKKFGHRVTVAANGRAALRTLSKGMFDLILMDIQMPVMGGEEVTAKIREKEKDGRRHVPIIAMTAHAMSGDPDRAFGAGMDDFLTKPIRADELRRVIQRHTPPSINVESLLEGVGGDRKLLNELVSLFSADAPKLLARCNRAIARNDADSLKKAAHALKGSVANFDAGRAFEAVRQLEKSGRDAHAAFAVAKSEVSRLIRTLKKLP